MGDFDSRMAELRARFVARLEDERGRLVAALRLDDREEVRRIAHGLSGSGGVFGFPEISAAAEEVEVAVDEGANEARVRELCARLLDRMEAAAQPL